ncbi:MAG: gamma-glutamyl-gamma-aminobutyrate hydrolase family protein [Acidobacteriaceae bacterium]
MSRPRIIIPVPTSFDAQYNARSWPQYAAACQQFEGQAIALPLELDQSEQARILACGTGILLPGSPADINPEKYGERRAPECARADALREAADELLLQDAFNLGKPLLGVCYGMQSLNVWRGGTLTQHLQTQINHRPGREVRQAHALVIATSSRLERLIAQDAAAGTTCVNSSHHQAVARAGDGLRVTATSEVDGTVEAFEGDDGFVLGVQWHPERTLSDSLLSCRIFEEFVRAAGQWALAPVRTSIG